MTQLPETLPNFGATKVLCAQTSLNTLNGLVDKKQAQRKRRSVRENLPAIIERHFPGIQIAQINPNSYDFFDRYFIGASLKVEVFGRVGPNKTYRIQVNYFDESQDSINGNPQTLDEEMQQYLKRRGFQDFKTPELI